MDMPVRDTPAPEAAPPQRRSQAERRAQSEPGYAVAVPEREIAVHTGGARTPVGLYRRADLAPGSRFAGPAVVAQEDTTVAIPAGAAARIDSHLNLHLTCAE